MFIAQRAELGGAMRDRNCILQAVTSVVVSTDVCRLTVSIFIMVPEGADCSPLICFTRNHLPLTDPVGHTAQDSAYFSSFIKHRLCLHSHKLTQLSAQGQAEEKSHSNRRWGQDPVAFQ